MEFLFVFRPFESPSPTLTSFPPKNFPPLTRNTRQPIIGKQLSAPTRDEKQRGLNCFCTANQSAGLR
jgi:hypothetical protein